MRKITIFLLFICELFSGCGNQNKQENQVFSAIDSVNSKQIYFLDLEQNIKNIKEDTFVINNISKNISFIPLETTKESLLRIEDFKVAKINESYYISSGGGVFTFTGIMEFDSTGHFIANLIQIGQGPKELPFIFEWYYNLSTQLLVASSSYEILIHSFENNTTNKYNLGGAFWRAHLLNDGSLVGFPNTIGDGDHNIPYMYFRNQEGEIIRSIYYPQKRNISNITENKTAVSTYKLSPHYSGDALFEDIFNDTIYRIKGVNDIEPYIIMHRGSLAPDKKDATNPTTRAQKINFSKKLETKKYFFIRYSYRGYQYNSIWDKQTLSLIANTKADYRDEYQIVLRNNMHSSNFTKYRTPNGKEILIIISSYADDKLYSVLDASQAMEFLPDIEEEDNPVLMVIELK